MSDTWRENAIVLAIQIIADKTVANAGFDKTIKAVVNKVLDKTTGKYQIRYQDSLFEAYATSADINYSKDDVVSVLIPGNDWDRTKTILSGVSNYATTYQQVPIVELQYNQIGGSGTKLNKNIELSSYKDQVIELNSTQISFPNIVKYIKKGDSIALGMTVRTALAPGQQVGGNYGVRFNLNFDDPTTSANNTIVKSFTIDISDVIGNPYGLTSLTPIGTLIKNVDTLNFKGVDSIEVFCEGFPLQDDNKAANIKDIIISSISINGAAALDEEDLSGYLLHLNYSLKGDTINSSIKLLPITAELKVNGKTIKSNVTYYWFRLNGTIFRGNIKYSGYAGEGWLCLNNFINKTPVGLKQPVFYFTANTENPSANKAKAVQRVNKILCVAVYNNLWIKGLTQVINLNIADLYIKSSDEVGIGLYKTIYYLGNGHPNLSCLGINGTATYTWTIKPSNKSVIKKDNTITDNTNYTKYKNEYDKQVNKANKMAKASADVYTKIPNGEYQTAISKWNSIKNKERVDGKYYYNFPVSSITDYTTISCAVVQNNTYKGTASITLYNKLLLLGMYSLNLEYGTQVFQYDGKGNSPTSPQIEKPIEIHPLSFTLIDNKGMLISFEQIKRDGWVKWIIPNTQTLLSSSGNGSGSTGSTDITVTRANLPLAASNYTVYKNLESFGYAIANRYDSKKNINYIWLNVKYKDFSFDAYTDFSFPKDGDPGTNGTDYVAKIGTNSTSDRVYISNKNVNLLFNDDGNEVKTKTDNNGDMLANLEFLLYNNSGKTSSYANYWTTPPKTSNTVSINGQNVIKEDVWTSRKSYLSVTGVKNESSDTTYRYAKVKFNSNTTQTFTDIQTNPPVNIVRGQYGTGTGQGNLKYFALIPICTNYIKVTDNYRIKVKPKTGFKYVVYSSNGDSPSYDNTLPFEIIVEKYKNGYFTTDTEETYTYIFAVIGNLNQGTSSDNKVNITPKPTYSGLDLTSAVVCQVKKGNTEIGFIHIPIYMVINRYGNRALNGWDGNTLQLDASGHGELLSPQIGAGAKDNNNAFTGILMGQIALNSSDDNVGKNNDIGLMGYDSGVRTIFLDAKTGKAEFGKNNQGKIIIDPDTIVKGQAGALLYSNGFNKDKYVTVANSKDEQGRYLDPTSKSNTYGSGLMIDLSTPTIQFGSGNFYVNSNGYIHAAGSGDIAGWNITSSAFYKHDGINKTGIQSSGDPAFYAGTNSQTTGTYNFYVNHDGYLFSKHGEIAGWVIRNKDLRKQVGTDSSAYYVGMNSDPDNSSYSVSGHKSKVFFANGDKFYVTHDGYFRSTSGKIASWDIGTDDNHNNLTNGNVGMGSQEIDKSRFGTNNNITARIWAGTKGEENFVVTNGGYLYSRKGKIAGWNITEDKLWAVNSDDSTKGIRIKSDGSMGGGAGYKNGTGGSWAINTDGSSSFTNITADHITATNATVTGKITAKELYASEDGKIAGWEISSNSLSGNGITISSGGSITGNGGTWKISGNGNALFKSVTALSGTLGSGTLNAGSSGGFSGNGGNWKMPGNGAPSWTYGDKTMTPQGVKVIEKLTLNITKPAAGSSMHILTGDVANTNVLTTSTNLKATEHTVEGSVDLTTGKYSFTYYTYELEKDYAQTTTGGSFMTIGAGQIATGWGDSTALQSILVMASKPNAQSVGTG